MINFHSLSVRFIVAAVGATAVTFIFFLALIIHQLDQNLDHQTTELERLEDEELRRWLDADIELANARLEFQSEDFARRVLGVATKADTIAAVKSRNMVAMEAVLDPAARIANVDTLILTDASFNVIGASIRDADLVALDLILERYGLRERIAEALTGSKPNAPRTISVYASHREVANFRSEGTADMVSLVSAVPVFDEFDGVIGALVGQHRLRAREPTLVELAEITGSSIAVYGDDALISTAGVGPDIRFKRQGDRLTALADQKELIARCDEGHRLLKVCAFKPLSELFAAQNEMTRIGKSESSRLVNWVIGIGVASTFLMFAAIAATSIPITRPLRELSTVVSSVARGDYDVSIRHDRRVDEIGEISKAVVKLRDSVKERDELRASVQIKNTELERQESELRQQNLLFDAALNNMSHGLCMFDARKRLIVSNNRYSEMFGVSSDLLESGIRFEELTAMQTSAVEWGAEDSDRPLDHTLDWPVEGQSSMTGRLADGRTILMTRQPLLGGGWVVIYEDISERQKARERLLHQARHDMLTNLPNRIQLTDALAERLEQIQPHKDCRFAVYCVDLDEFKDVNDTLGHPTGDLLLQRVADRLVQTAGEDYLVVRLGGDEFAVVSPVGVDQDYSDLPKQLIAAICEPYSLMGQEVIIGGSIGAAIAPRDGVDPDELMKNADLALYMAKADGGNDVRFFRSDMAERVLERQQLISDLRYAIESSEMAVFLQPQIRLSDNSIVGFEGLARWHHARDGLITPASFIPTAEETGLIVPIGEWILRESCRIAAEWPVPVRIAVNVSARQVRDPGFSAVVVNALASTGLPASRLELEITESVVLQDDDQTRSTLLQLKALGIMVAMDDFGTGYSSLSCLRSFPFDKIKIDQSFVRSMATSDEANSIVTAIIELAEGLNIATTAEGIEDEATFHNLRSKGCHEGQGYFFGRPLPAEESSRLLGCDQNGELDQRLSA